LHELIEIKMNVCDIHKKEKERKSRFVFNREERKYHFPIKKCQLAEKQHEVLLRVADNYV